MFQDSVMNQQNVVPQRPPTVYEAHEAAVRQYHQACEAFQKAQMQRVQASQNLSKATEELGRHVQLTADDPTAPQQAQVQGGLHAPNSLRPY